MSGLPEEFTNDNGLKKLGITGDSIKIKLLQEIKVPDMMQGEFEGAAFLVKNKKVGTKGQSKVRKCFNYGKPGHFVAKCRLKSYKKEIKRR